nr:MAG TPA: hypothetical protein [Caudoviricetes sp.]
MPARLRFSISSTYLVKPTYGVSSIVELLEHVHDHMEL